jgi:excisionase family DNA binding protein
MTTEEQLLLRPSEAARLLAISERTLWQLTADGVIPCVRLGRCKRYDPDDLKRQVNQLKTTLSV